MTVMLPIDRLSTAAAAVLQQRRNAESAVLVPPPSSLAESAALPDLPRGTTLAPLTASVTVQTSGGLQVEIARQIVTRTLDHVHVALAGGEEWLFVRHPVDPRRTSGAAVYHSAQTIVIYEESELRSVKGIRGWADVVMFGLSVDLIDGVVRQRDTRVVSGVLFTRYTAAGTAAILRDLWWNADQALPERYTVRAAATIVHVTLNRLQPSVNERLLVPPASRFPGYRVIDVATWLER